MKIVVDPLRRNVRINQQAARSTLQLQVAEDCDRVAAFGRVPKACEMVVRPQIICVKESDPFASCGSNAAIPRGRNSRIVLLNQLEMRQASRLDQGRAGVGRSVVNNYELKIDVCLTNYRPQRSQDAVCLVIQGYHDSDERLPADDHTCFHGYLAATMAAVSDHDYSGARTQRQS